MELLQNEFHCTLYTMYYETVMNNSSLEQIKAGIT